VTTSAATFPGRSSLIPVKKTGSRESNNTIEMKPRNKTYTLNSNSVRKEKYNLDLDSYNELASPLNPVKNTESRFYYVIAFETSQVE
jgi:hypothetical protein